MCARRPKIPKPKPIRVASTDNREAASAARLEATLRRRRAGAAADILTGPMGIPATPVLGGVAAAADVPAEHLILPVALAASCSFMLPVATAPNAVVYASGAVTMGQMIKAGFRINIVAAPIIAMLASFLAPMVFPA